MRTLMQIAEDARRSKYAVAKLGTNDKKPRHSRHCGHADGTCGRDHRGKQD